MDHHHDMCRGTHGPTPSRLLFPHPPHAAVGARSKSLFADPGARRQPGTGEVTVPPNISVMQSISSQEGSHADISPAEVPRHVVTTWTPGSRRCCVKEEMPPCSLVTLRQPCWDRAPVLQPAGMGRADPAEKDHFPHLLSKARLRRHLQRGKHLGLVFTLQCLRDIPSPYCQWTKILPSPRVSPRSPPNRVLHANTSKPGC